MPFRIKETDMQGKVSLVPFIVAGEHVQRVSVKIGVKVTVPAPGSIRVRVMPGAGTVVNAIFGTFADPVSAGIGMGVDTGAVPRCCEIVRFNKPQFYGRDNGSNREELLQGFFIIKRKGIIINEEE